MITGLGHTGFWVDDLEKMRDFYTRVMGLTVTDEDEDASLPGGETRRDDN